MCHKYFTCCVLGHIEPLFNDILLLTQKHTSLEEAVKMIYDHDRQERRHPEWHTTAYQARAGDHLVARAQDTGRSTNEEWQHHQEREEVLKKNRSLFKMFTC